MNKTDVLIIGAGAAGLMCAMHAGSRKRNVTIIEHAKKPGRKILMSGGGRCNFTNLDITPDNFICQNPHFHKSALSRYTQWDFIDWVKSHQIAYNEKTQGQLFCDEKASVLLDALCQDCQQPNIQLQLNTTVLKSEQLPNQSGFVCHTSEGIYHTESLVIATGGLSIPSMKSNPFAYQLAQQFNVPVIPTRAGLVPFTLDTKDKNILQDLSGISTKCQLSTGKTSFQDDLLITHRGLSGPAALQLSSYWHGGETVIINFLPQQSMETELQQARQGQPRQTVKTWFNQHLPNRLVQALLTEEVATKRLADLSSHHIQDLVKIFHHYSLIPSGTEGYRTAEVTLGGIDTNALCSKNMCVKAQPNLYFIGEAVDVTGWLGGYNFQWAWSSGWAAGQAC